METVQKMIEEHHALERKISALEHNIRADSKLARVVARRLCPDLYEAHLEDEDKEYTRLNKLLGKWDLNNLPRFPGSTVSPVHGATMIRGITTIEDKFNERVWMQMKLRLNSLSLERNEIRRKRKKARKPAAKPKKVIKKK